MAFLTFVGCVGEGKVGMAVATRHGGVSPAKWETGTRVIEADSAGEDLPILCGVTVGARDVQLPMRALGGCNGVRGLKSAARR